MDILKITIITAPALIFIDYGPDRREIIFTVDFNLDRWGATFSQIKTKKNTLSRYESGLWNNAERNYDAIKREYRGVLKTLKKVRSWLYGMYFVLKIDAHVLLHQLNRFGTDLPGTLITR
jgi:hypothetical protein